MCRRWRAGRDGTPSFNVVHDEARPRGDAKPRTATSNLDLPGTRSPHSETCVEGRRLCNGLASVPPVGNGQLQRLTALISDRSLQHSVQRVPLRPVEEVRGTLNSRHAMTGNGASPS